MKREQKRSILISIVIAVCFIVVTALFRIKKYPDWYFYDRFIKAQQSSAIDEVSQSVQINLNNLPVFQTVDKHLLSIFQSTKASLREAFGNIDSLNWERFDKTTIIEGQYFLFEQWDAVWSSKTNIVFVFQYLKEKADNEIETVIAHELIRALTEQGTSILYEGLTEYMNTLLYGNNNNNYAAYELPIKIIQLYVDKYGLEATIDIFRKGDPLDALCELTPERPDAFKKIEGILRSKSYIFDTDHFLVIFDVMAHYCNNINGDVTVVEDLIEKYLGLPNSDIYSYYDSILRR